MWSPFVQVWSLLTNAVSYTFLSHFTSEKKMLSLLPISVSFTQHRHHILDRILYRFVPACICHNVALSIKSVHVFVSVIWNRETNNQPKVKPKLAYLSFALPFYMCFGWLALLYTCSAVKYINRTRFMALFSSGFLWMWRFAIVSHEHRCFHLIFTQSANHSKSHSHLSSIFCFLGFFWLWF